MDASALVRLSAMKIRMSKTARTRASSAPNQQPPGIVISHCKQRSTGQAKLRSDFSKNLDVAKRQSSGMFGLDIQSLIGFRDNLIDDGFHVMPAFPESQLSIRPRTFAHDALDMRHFIFTAELFNFG